MDRTLLLMDGILEEEQVATRPNLAAPTNFP
jgi:hypothetical protein